MFFHLLRRVANLRRSPVRLRLRARPAPRLCIPCRTSIARSYLIIVHPSPSKNGPRAKRLSISEHHIPTFTRPSAVRAAERRAGGCVARCALTLPPPRPQGGTHAVHAHCGSVLIARCGRGEGAGGCGSTTPARREGGEGVMERPPQSRSFHSEIVLFS